MLTKQTFFTVFSISAMAFLATTSSISAQEKSARTRPSQMATATQMRMKVKPPFKTTYLKDVRKKITSANQKAGLHLIDRGSSSGAELFVNVRRGKRPELQVIAMNGRQVPAKMVTTRSKNKTIYWVWFYDAHGKTALLAGAIWDGVKSRSEKVKLIVSNGFSDAISKTVIRSLLDVSLLRFDHVSQWNWRFIPLPGKPQAK